MPTIFITGIDTDIGKTIATGMMAAYLKHSGVNVMTQKMVQTGCEKISEDILLHRRIMGIHPVQADLDGLTCPYLFRHAASPHLAAAMEGKKIDLDRIRQATQKLSQMYDLLLVEGAGGLFVPLDETLYLIDYLQSRGDPVILVSSARLGSINHTLLSIEALTRRKIPIAGIVYNCFPETDPAITGDSQKAIQAFLNQILCPAPIVRMGQVNLQDLEAMSPEENQPMLDFGIFFDKIRI